MENVAGTVVKITNKYIVLILPDGSFKNIKRSRGYVPLLGEKLTLNTAGTPAVRYRWIAATAAVCILIAAVLRFSLFMPDKLNTSYIVALDINPSMEIETNEQFKITAIQALNDDAGKIISDTAYLNTDLFESLNRIIGNCIRYGYLKPEKKGFVKISVISMNGKSFGYENVIKDSLQSLLKNNDIKAALEIGNASEDTLQKAHQAKISVNRYILYRNITEKGLDITLEEARKLPLQQLEDYDGIEDRQEEANVPAQGHTGDSSSYSDNMTDKLIENGANNGLSSEGSRPGNFSEFSNNNANGNTKAETSQSITASSTADKTSGETTNINAGGGGGSDGAETKPEGRSTGSNPAGTSKNEVTSESGNSDMTEMTKNSLQTGESTCPIQSDEGTKGGNTGGSSNISNGSTDNRRVN